MANTSMNRWQPTQQLTSLRDAIDRIFDESFTRSGRLMEGVGAGFPMDIYEEGQSYIVDASMPGIKPDDVDIQLHGNTLTIKGKISEPTEKKGRGYLLQERVTGEFSRTITLPAEVDANKVDATFEDGVLHLVLPKTPAYQPKHIPVKTGHS